MSIQLENPTTSKTKNLTKTWLLPAVTGIAAFLIGIGAGSSGNVPQADLDKANQSLKTVTQERDNIQKTLDTIQESDDQKAKELEDANQAVKDAEKALEERKITLDEQELSVKKREEAVSGKEKESKQNTFGEGRWIVGEDIKAGTYKTTEPVTSTDCYWAITSSGSNGDDIISNDFGTQGNHTVTLRKGQDFESRNCGSWKLK